MNRPLVVLVYTRTGWDFKNVTSLLPLSVLYLVRPLRQAGFDVALIDQRIDPHWEATLRQQAPNAVLVGISAMTGAQIGWGLQAAQIVRQVAGHVPLVWGGIHPSLMPVQTAMHPLVDIVVQGEGEITLPELARALATGRDLQDVPGLTLARGEEVIRTAARPPMENIDDALIPDYEAVSIEDYVTAQTLGIRDLAITTSRGCPHGCRYCYNQPFSHRRWRAQSAEAAIEHIKLIVRRFGIHGILIKDDNFYVDRARVEAIAEGLQREGLQVTIRGECRADYIARQWSPEFLTFLYERGFREMTVGAESGDDDVLQKLGKGITVADIREANLRLRSAKIPTKFTFMTGFLFENEASLKKTIDLMLALTDDNPFARVTPLHLYSPYPGTPMYEEAQDAGYQAPKNLNEWADVSFHDLDLPWFSPRKSRRLERASLATYFLDRQTVAEYFTGRPFIQFAARVYSAIIRWRCRRLFFRFMPEAALINWYRGKIR